MREAQAPPPTEGARGGNICSDACMCFSENVNCGMSKENVQGRTRGSESAAHESDDTHYLLRDPPETDGSKRRRKMKNEGGKADQRTRRGKFKKKGKKLHSRKAAYVQTLSVEEAIRMLEEDLNKLGTSAPKSKPQEPARRSARLARSQRRTGRWRNNVRQREEAEEASRRAE